MKIKQIVTFSLLILLLFIFTGCVQKNVIEPNSLITDASLLKPSPLNKNSMYYMKKNTDFNRYNSIRVPHIEVLTNSKNQMFLNKKLLNVTSIYFTNKLDKSLNNILKNNAGKNKLLLQVSIVSLDVSFDDLAFYQYLPYGLAFTALKRGVGIETRKLRIHMALKLLDNQTKETLAMVVTKNIDKEVESIESLKFSHIKPVLDEWIALYTLRLQELNEGKYKITKE